MAKFKITVELIKDEAVVKSMSETITPEIGPLPSTVNLIEMSDRQIQAHMFEPTFTKIGSLARELALDAVMSTMADVRDSFKLDISEIAPTEE